MHSIKEKEKEKVKGFALRTGRGNKVLLDLVTVVDVKVARYLEGGRGGLQEDVKLISNVTICWCSFGRIKNHVLGTPACRCI